MFIYEKNILKIYYYKDLVSINENEVKIFFGKYNLLIKGNKLNIDYFETEELHVTGMISSINFDYAR